MRLLVALTLALVLIPSVALAAPVSGDVLGAWGVLGLVLAVGVLVGSGIVPTGALGAELQAVTRRAFVPKLVVQNLYKATPVLAAGIANAQTASGGVSSVTVPVQGTAFVTAQATDYSGSFNQPTTQQGAYEASYNLKAVVVPIPFLGFEGIVQLNAAVIPLIEARMNDAGNAVTQYLSTQLFTNGADQTINIDGFPLITATTGTYGNLSRSTNTWWQGFTRATPSAAPTRLTVMHDILAAAKANGGEMPNMGVMGPGTWSKLQDDYLALESYHITPSANFADNMMGARASFTALQVGTVPIYIDNDMPEQQLLLYNTRYDSFYIHEAAAFAFTGFASTLPNFQLGYVGALVAVLEHINVKPSSCALITGYSSINTI